jgi:hypothetical protein
MWLVAMRKTLPTEDEADTLGSFEAEMYLNQENRWWTDKANGTMYPSREEAESAAFSTVIAEPSLLGFVQVEKAS